MGREYSLLVERRVLSILQREVGTPFINPRHSPEPKMGVNLTCAKSSQVGLQSNRPSLWDALFLGASSVPRCEPWCWNMNPLQNWVIKMGVNVGIHIPAPWFASGVYFIQTPYYSTQQVTWRPWPHDPQAMFATVPTTASTMIS